MGIHTLSSEATVEGKNRFDEPAINATIFRAQPNLTLIPHRYNAQVSCSRATDWRTIWTFMHHNLTVLTTEFEVLVRRSLDGEKLSATSEIASIIIHGDDIYSSMMSLQIE